MQHAHPSKWTIALGGLIGAMIAFVGILIGSSIARMTVPDHSGAAHHDAAGHAE